MRLATSLVVLAIALVAVPAPVVSSEPAARTPDLLRYTLRSPTPGTEAASWKLRPQRRIDGGSLAQADFDADGLPDLAIGLASAGEAWVEVRPGRPLGERHPFGAAGEPQSLTATPDFLTAGDFDRDGRPDLVAASRSAASLWWLPGRGDGGFFEPVEVPLPGSVTALVAAMLDAADGLDDLAVAVNGAGGPEVLLYRSTRASFLEAPSRVPLSAPATALAIADLAGGPGRDLAVAAGDELAIVFGTDHPVAGRTPDRDGVVRLPLRFEALALATGDFLGRRSDRQDLALLVADGTAEILYWSSGKPGAAAELAFRAGEEAGWQRAALSGLALRSAPRAGAVHLLPVRQEVSATDGLVVVSAGSAEAEVIALPGGEAAGLGGRRGDGHLLRPAGRRTLAVAEPAAVLPALINGDALTDLVVLDGAGELEVLATATGTTFVVNSTGAHFDDDVGDGVCHSTAGTCTLWAAVQESEALPGADTIHFAINPSAPSGFPRTITYALQLQTLDGPVTIEGPNQGGATVVLDGSQLADDSGAVAFRFDAASSGVVLRNLTIAGFAQSAISLSGSGHVVEGIRFTGNGWRAGGNTVISVAGASHRIGGTTSAARNVIVGSPGETGIRVVSTAGTGIQILGNRIGIEPGGAPDPVGTGIRLERGAQVGSSAAGGGNVVLSSFTGIHLAEADGAQIWGNSVGATHDGAVVGDALFGLWIDGGDGILVGGAGIGLGNVVSGNDTAGIRLTDQHSSVAPANVTIFGNRIGTDLSGATAVPNGTGIGGLDAFNLTVGGSGAAGNVISGNTGTAISLTEGVHSATLQGNLVGTDASGNTALANGAGIHLARVDDVVVGGGGPGEGNLISGNGGIGIRIVEPAPDGVTVLGNRIGLKMDGGPRGNLGHGIRVEDANGIKIGGPAAPNQIAHNAGAGVFVTWGWGVDIRANSIHSNSELGIDLGDGTVSPDGVSLNDPGDPDVGPNDLQNFPVLDAVFTDGMESRVFGKLEALANLSHRIDVYSNATCDAAGHGEGRTYLGATTVTTDADGIAHFMLPVPELIFPGSAVTATATRVSPGNTSELSRCLASEICAGEDDRVVTGETLSGTQTLEACRSIAAHTGVQVTGDVTFRAGRRIVLGDGFSVGPGGSFTAIVELP